jgi:hypothetical protein
MRKLLLGLALCVVATAASAERVLVEISAIGTKLYADPATKKRTGNVVRMWIFYDYSKPLQMVGGKTYYSARYYDQYNCAERTNQTFQLAAFAGKMPTGDVVGTHNQPFDKSFVAPGTTAEAMLDFACK